MESNFRIKAALLASMLIFAGTVMAQTIETNIPGIVIKDLECPSWDTRRLIGKIVNRNSEPFSGKIRTKLIDRDNDIIWQGLENIKIEAQNGASLSIRVGVGECLAPTKVQITLER